MLTLVSAVSADSYNLWNCCSISVKGAGIEV